MNAMRRPWLVATILLLAACMSAPDSPSDAVMWSLGEPRVRMDGGDTPLFRVRAAVFLGDGSIAIADAGNYRVVRLSSRGEFLGDLGGEGEGPGEFSSVSALAAFGDTLVAYDAISNRLTMWPTMGADPVVTGLPPYLGRPTTWVGGISAGQSVLKTLEPAAARRQSLFVDSTNVMRWIHADASVESLGTEADRYLYFFIQGRGATSYRTPFFSEAKRVVWGSSVLTLPLDGTKVLLRALDRVELDSVALPVTTRPFDRAVIERYRDSLLELVGPGANADRIREAYDAIDPPSSAPPTRRIVLVGDRLWVERFPTLGEETTSWWLVSIASREVEGVIELPPNRTPLAGQGDQVLMLEWDELGVEVVVLLDLLPG